MVVFYNQVRMCLLNSGFTFVSKGLLGYTRQQFGEVYKEIPAGLQLRLQHCRNQLFGHQGQITRKNAYGQH